MAVSGLARAPCCSCWSLRTPWTHWRTDSGPWLLRPEVLLRGIYQWGNRNLISDADFITCSPCFRDALNFLGVSFKNLHGAYILWDSIYVNFQKRQIYAGGKKKNGCLWESYEGTSGWWCNLHLDRGLGNTGTDVCLNLAKVPLILVYFIMWKI